MGEDTFYILNFGCRASQADGAALKQQMLGAGFEEAAALEASRIAILNTCTVTATADAEVRQMVRRIHRLSPHCRILVTGCYAQRAPEEIARLGGVAWVVGNSHKHLVSDLIAQRIDAAIASDPPQPTSPLVQIQVADQTGKRAIPPEFTNDPMTRWPDDPILSARAPSPQPPAPPQILVGEITDEFHFAPVFADDRTRPTLKIQDGCDARCSFCVIPTVRGPSRSLDPEKVIEQVRRLEEAGYQEVVLSGINLGGYGRDLGGRINFLGMVERILRESSLPRIRISSIEPMDVSPALIRLVAQESRLAQHFHIPLQSGCDRILRLMHRRYWAEHYAERIRAIHEQIPNGAIGADVMVGFPGETDEDHAANSQFIESLPFTYLHIFPFSARPGTRAAAASSQVNGRVAHQRSQEIRSIIGSKRDAFLAAQAGAVLSAVTLDEVEAGARAALTTNYLKVELWGGEIPPNRLLDVRIARAESGKLFGYPCPASSRPAAVSVPQ